MESCRLIDMVWTTIIVVRAISALNKEAEQSSRASLMLS
jgi:hypothetical protein